MKKLLEGLFILSIIFIGTQAHASVLSDALLQIQNLKNEIIQLKSKLGASALDSSSSYGSSSYNIPSITMISQFGGGSVESGSKMEIRWSSANIVGAVVDVYVSDGIHKGHSVSVNNNIGSVIYTLDSNLVPGSNYKAYVWLSSISNPIIIASSGVFTIRPVSISSTCPNGATNYPTCTVTPTCPNIAKPLPSFCPNGTIETVKNTNSCISYKCTPNVPVINPLITVLSPNGGETYKAGDKMNVKWISSLPDMGGYAGGFRIRILIKNGDSIFKDVTTNDDGQESIEIPSLANGNYVLEIGSTYDSSGGSHYTKYNTVKFTIKSATTPSITVLSPNGGETYTEGEQITVKWNTSNILAGTSLNFVLKGYDSNGKLLMSESLSGRAIFNSGSSLITLPKDAIYDGVKFGKYFKIEISSPGVTPDSSDNYFTINSSTTKNDPIISGVSGPQSLKVGETGTWTVTASSPNKGNLSYSVNWGDNPQISYSTSSAQSSIKTGQSTTFTHSYEKAGIYAPTFKVTSENTIPCITTPTALITACPSNGGSATTSISVNVGNTTTPSITVLSPNGRETYKLGDPIKLKWKSEIFSANAKIAVYLEEILINGASETLYGLGDLINDDGEETIYLNPAFMITKYGKYFKINLKYLTDGKVEKEGGSSNLFTIKESTTYGCKNGEVYSSTTGQKCSIVPSITVLSPNGGESLSKGKIETIKWSDTTLYNNNSTSFFYYNVSLIKAQNPCTQKTCPVADSYLVASKIKIPQGEKINSFDWIVGNTDQKNKIVPDGAYMIQICKTDVKTCDLSDNYFKINSEKTSTSITVLSPNGKETYKLGDKINISWKSSMDLDDSQVNIALINDDTNACKGRFTGQPSGINNSAILTYGLNDSNCNNILVSHPIITFLAQNQLNATSKPNGTYLIDTSHLGSLNSVFNAGVKYKIAVCIDKTCDTSDKYFTITDSTPNSSNAYGTDICPSNMINPYSLCIDGNIQADKKDANGCTLSYKCANPSSTISSTTPTISTRILMVGVKGDDVAALQTLLGITADGSFGPMTKAKVMEWQLTNELTPDGVFGNMSRLKAGL